MQKMTIKRMKQQIDGRQPMVFPQSSSFQHIPQTSTLVFSITSLATFSSFAIGDGFKFAILLLAKAQPCMPRLVVKLNQEQELRITCTLNFHFQNQEICSLPQSRYTVLRSGFSLLQPACVNLRAPCSHTENRRYFHNLLYFRKLILTF